MPRDFTQGPALGQIYEEQYVKGMIIFQWEKVGKFNKCLKYNGNERVGEEQLIM